MRWIRRNERDEKLTTVMEINDTPNIQNVLGYFLFDVVLRPSVQSFLFGFGDIIRDTNFITFRHQ